MVWVLPLLTPNMILRFTEACLWRKGETVKEAKQWTSVWLWKLSLFSCFALFVRQQKLFPETSLSYGLKLRLAEYRSSSEFFPVFLGEDAQKKKSRVIKSARFGIQRSKALKKYGNSLWNKFKASKMLRAGCDLIYWDATVVHANVSEVAI